MRKLDVIFPLIGMSITAAGAMFCVHFLSTNPVTNGCAYLVFGILTLGLVCGFAVLGTQLVGPLVETTRRRLTLHTQHLGKRRVA